MERAAATRIAESPIHDRATCRCFARVVRRGSPLRHIEPESSAVLSRSRAHELAMHSRAAITARSSLVEAMRGSDAAFRA